MSIKRLVPLNTVSLPSNPPTAIAGDIYYNSGLSKLLYFNGTDWIELAGSANSLVYAKSIYQDVRNQSGATIPIGTPVYISGAIGASGKILISPASNASEATSSKTMAITTSAISNNSNGQIISEGLLEGIDTTGASDGDPVWLGVNGAKIYGLANKPAAPAHLVFLGIVVNGGSANAGSIFVKIQNGFELQEIHNVSISSLLNGNILAYDSTTSTWKNTNTLQSTSSTVPLVIKGAASQTANLQEWQTSTGSILGKLDKDGKLTTIDIESGALNATWRVYSTAGAPTVVPITAKGAASQTANLQEWQNSAGTVLGYIGATGGAKFAGLDVQMTGSAIVNIGTAASSLVGLIVRGVASQTANLQEWQNSAGTILASINANGGLFIKPTSTSGNLLKFENTGNTYGWSVPANEANSIVFDVNQDPRIYWGSNTIWTMEGAPNSSVFRPYSSGRYGLTVKGLVSQTGALQHWQNSSGTTLVQIGSGGDLFMSNATRAFFGGADMDGYVNISTSGNAARQGIVIKAAASQTANMQEWQNSSGTITARVGNGGQIVSSGVGVFGSQSNTSNAQLAVIANSLVYPTFVAKAIASQTANLTEWQNSSAAVLAKVDANGKILVYGDDLGNFQSIGSTTTLYNGFTATNNNNLGSYTLGTAGSAETTFNVPNAFYIYDRINGAMRFKIMSTGLVGINSYTPAAQLQVNASSASTVALIAKATTSQTADIQQWQISDGTVRMRVAGDGTFGTSGNIYANRYYYSSNGTASGTSISFLDGSNGGGLSIRNIDLGTPNAAFDGIVPLSVSGNLNQTADLQHWKNSVGTVLSGINPAGQIYAGTTTSINGSITGEITSATKVSSTVASFGYTGTSLVKVGQRVTISSPSGDYDGTGFNGTWIVTAVTSNTFTVLGSGFVGWLVSPESENGIFTLSAAGSFVANTALTTSVAVRGVASQTANLQEWQNVSGTVLAKIDASGNATAASFVKTSGTSSQFLKADGSVDSSTYLTTGTASSTYLPLTGGTVSSDLTVTGNFTVNGTTTNLNSTNLVVEDKNIIVADVTTPTDTTADGAGITIKGATDKTLNWVQSTGSFTSSEPFIINTNSTTRSNLIVKAIASQSGNLQEWQDSTGTVLSSISSAGSLNLGAGKLISFSNGTVQKISLGYSGDYSIGVDDYTTVITANNSASNGRVGIRPHTATYGTSYISPIELYANGQIKQSLTATSVVGHIIKAVASQTANLQEWQDSAGTVLSSITYFGGARLYDLGIKGSPAGIGWAYFGNDNTSTKNVVVRGFASQTANLQEWQNSAGTALVSISSDGVINKTGTTNIGPILTFANPGVGQDTRFNFTKSSDAAWLSVVERTADNTYYEFGMSDNPTGGDYFQWKFDNYESAAQGWMPLQMGAMETRFTSAVSNWGSYSIPVNTPFTTLNSSATSSTEFQVNKYAPTNNTAQVLNKDSGTGTGTVTLNAQSYTNTFRLGYWIRIDAGATTFSWGYGFTSNAPIATGVAITGSAQTLGSGVTVTLSLTNHVAGDTWSFLCFPRPTVGIGGAPLLTSMHTVYTAAAVVGSVIRGAVSQTANLQEWQNSAGTVLALVDAYGRLGINTTSLPNSTGSYSMVSIYNHNTVNSNLIIKAYPSQTATLTEWHNSSGTALAKIDVLGNFTATSKSFDIPHPTKENMRLRYASLEGNEHGVYVRGITKEKFIELPEYWTELVDESTITVSLTSVGKFQKVYVEKIEGNKIYIGGRVKEISYAVFGERKDIDKLIVEY